MKTCVAFLLLTLQLSGLAQIPELIISPQIRSVQLHPVGNQLAYPILRLNSGEKLELHFDDLDAGVKYYAYTFQLCNADWTPALLNQFDFIKGYSSQRITTYRISSIAFTKYTHYTATLPDANCFPTRSGNYILKVFKDGDTSKLIFTRKMLILQEKSSTIAQIQQPFNTQYYRSYQKVNFKVAFKEGLDISNHLQQIKVIILQNNRWDNAANQIRPTFFSMNSMEFNTEADCVFPAGKEWRWLDLRSLRFQSDRIARANYGKNFTEIFVKEEGSRANQAFNFFGDMNGLYTIAVTESINPYWQGDYASVHFTYKPENQNPFPDKDIFVFGKLTDYNLNDAFKMQFNGDKGVYETTLMLKQGYYDYCYVTIDRKDKSRKASFEFTEGNYWESENNYTILVYYRPLGGRADELIGVTGINSLAGRR